MLKTIIPLGGSSVEFLKAGYIYPKPLIEIKGRTMIEWVIENPANIDFPNQFIFILKKDDVLKFHLDNALRILYPSCKIVVLTGETMGATCSVLMAIDCINKDDQILILNGDQVIDLDFNIPLKFWMDNGIDCGLVTFKSIHPRWSYAKTDDENNVLQTAEKNPISSNAIAGYYYFSRAQDFFSAAFQSIKDNASYDGVFYISPIVNQFVLMNKRSVVFPISESQYYSFYSPKMIEEFNNRSKVK